MQRSISERVDISEVMNKLMEQRIKDRSCTICDGLIAFGDGVRAVSKKRCDDCKDGSNWGLYPTDSSRGR